MDAPRQIGLGLDLDTPATEKVEDVIKDLSCRCTDCGLGLLYPTNPGLIIRGNPMGRYAFVSEMPGRSEWELKPPKPMMGPAGEEFNFWCDKKLGIDNNTEALVINVIQCKTPHIQHIAKGKKFVKQRSPYPNELNKCFPRCLRVLKAMPNLQCIIALGSVATGMLIKAKPLEKTHTGNWIKLRTFPKAIMYVLPHPAALLHESSQSKMVTTMHLLERFRRELPKMLKEIR